MYHTFEHMLRHLSGHLNGSRNPCLPRPYFPLAIDYTRHIYTLDLQPARLIPSRTFAEARHLFHYIWRMLPGSISPGTRPDDLGQLLATKLRQFPDLRVNKVIGIGCGSFARLDHDGVCERHGPACQRRCHARMWGMRSAARHLFVAALWAFFDIRARGVGERAAFLLEDQDYMEVDLQVLRREGLGVVTHPESILAVDGRSVLVCVEASFPVRQIVEDVARPAVIIWERPDDGTAQGVGGVDWLGNGEEGVPLPPLP
jgi:hypothetical protein